MRRIFVVLFTCCLSDHSLMVGVGQITDVSLGVQKVNAHLTIHSVAGYSFVSMGHTVDGTCDPLTVNLDDNGSALPAPGATVDLFELGGIRFGGGFHIRVIVSANHGHIQLDAGFNVNDLDLVPPTEPLSDPSPPVTHLTDRYAAGIGGGFVIGGFRRGSRFGRRLNDFLNRCTLGTVIKEDIVGVRTCYTISGKAVIFLEGGDGLFGFFTIIIRDLVIKIAKVTQTALQHDDLIAGGALSQDNGVVVIKGFIGCQSWRWCW